VRPAATLPLPSLEPLAAAADDPVLRLLADRAAAAGRPGHHEDGQRLALAIEGGGMAGAVSAGMCVALEELGLIECFDLIYGSSSGAINASYTAAGQAGRRAALYLAAAEARLVDPRRALRGRPPFRLGKLVNSLLALHAHDRKVLHGGPALRITGTRVEDKGLDVLAGFSSVAEIRQAVWASCAIPILAGDIVDFRGTSYVDGGLVESIPYAAAVREGATHVLVLRARPAAFRFREYSPAALGLCRLLLRNAPKTVLELIRERPGRYNAEAEALAATGGGALAGHVRQLAPPEDAALASQFEVRPDRLSAAIGLGRRTALAELAPSFWGLQDRRARPLAPPSLCGRGR
jgi:predicted patatin/cPLA2 family phospholipase